jgi:predicted hotdog family 3-hydroxylacyl-ACP dehydratase
MCLLDEVVEWSTDDICCRSNSHRRADNVLRAHGRLGIACGVEYAAQAMAVHGALRAANSSLQYRAGLLASVRGLTMSVDRLDDIDGDLFANATLVHGDGTMVLYEFSLAASNRVLMSGRATIAFGAVSGGPPAMRALS